MNITRYCLALDLVNDAQMIEQYEKYHETPRPEILKSIHDAGITLMEIYRIGDRLFMIIETDETFSFEKKEAMDKSNPQVQVWEQLMWKYQKAVPGAKPGEKWVLMKKIFGSTR
jgi:L-rhamnose mutarotase